MFSLFFIASLPLVCDTEPGQTLRYLRRADNQFVLESVITTRVLGKAKTFSSVTDRGAEKMTLTIRFQEGRLAAAEAIQETAHKKNVVSLICGEQGAELHRGNRIEKLQDFSSHAIVTTAPDWSDILQIVERYDRDKGGRQEYAGLWIHPLKATLRLTFTVECVGHDLLKHKEERLRLDRYRIRLRSGDYLVWADATRRIIQLMPAGNAAAKVVLEGFEVSAEVLKNGQ